MRLAHKLAAYLEREPVGEVMRSPADISWGRPDVLVQPDVFVVPAGLPSTARWGDVRRLLLAAETLSPSTARQDRFTKRRLYQAQRVPVYWVVDADARRVEVWTPDDDFPRVERERLVWHPAGAGAPFELALDALLAGAGPDA
jgi:Uma2 family endonuclease